MSCFFVLFFSVSTGSCCCCCLPATLVYVSWPWRNSLHPSGLCPSSPYRAGKEFFSFDFQSFIFHGRLLLNVNQHKHVLLVSFQREFERFSEQFTSTQYSLTATRCHQRQIQQSQPCHCTLALRCIHNCTLNKRKNKTELTSSSFFFFLISHNKLILHFTMAY